MLQVIGIIAFVFAILFSIAWHELGHPFRRRSLASRSRST